MYQENINTLQLLDKCGIPLNRNCVDPSTNGYGYSLVDFCKNNNLFILNGRIGNDRDRPQLTCKNSSVVDYFISSAHIMPNILDLHVHEFSSLYSDAHCLIELTLIIQTTDNPSHSENNPSSTKTKLWNSDKCESFVNNIDILKLAEIEMHLDKIMENDNAISKEEINEVVLEIGNLFESTAKETFGSIHIKNKKNKNTKPVIKPWFNTDCVRARNMYHRSRRMYNKYKTDYYKNILKIVSKKYKKTLSYHNRQFTNQKSNNLRELRNKHPREYWKIINSHKKCSDSQATLNDFYNFFKSTNEMSTEPDMEPRNDNPEDLLNETINVNVENEVNQPITEAEILKSVKSLKNNKASGEDNIVNEHIKSTIHLLLPIYCKLFNIILDTGIIPETWSVGVIKPIYKNKGDPKNAENYRPITLLSCFGKLFTSIINNRLNDFAESHGTINWNQAGFRKNFSTTDNLFVLKSLIDIMKYQHKKLYCCFVDFKQAFDTVWRAGLWQKLCDHGFKGKCYNVILNLYKDIKSKVSTNEGNTDYFECMIGVRQGENLSPFLFSIFLNDLDFFLTTKRVPGVACDFAMEEINIYLKLIILLMLMIQ